MKRWAALPGSSTTAASVAPTPPPNAIGRSSWTFAGPDAGGQEAAVVPTPIETCE
ncbi:MAG: hypothetical protein WBF43_06925 [Methylocella sp.]